MKIKLINALRMAATALENGTFCYNERQLNQCNCGVLFCTLTGKSAASFGPEIPLAPGAFTTWTDLTGRFCSVSGQSENELFSLLLSFGLTPKDIVDTEYLRNEKVIARMKNPIPRTKKKWYGRRVIAKSVDYTNTRNVIDYFRAWADLLTEEGSPIARFQDEEHASFS